jgi:hypothetical protein
MNWTAIISVLSLFVAAPAIVFGFIYLSKKNRADVEIMRYKREILELELERERIRLRAIEAENVKYDNMIGDGGR